MVTFLHTADWQLGKPFGRIADDDKRARARRARLESVQAMGQIARENAAEFIVVAGDLFDMEQPTRSLVHEACGVIGAIDVPVYVIPGNHDSGAPGNVWHRSDFRRIRAEHAPNLHVLLEAAPVLAPGALLLPCPLLRRHTIGDPGAWLGPEALEGADPALPVVALAHGSVHSFTDSDAPTNLLDIEAWQRALPIDYVALGDWHGTKRIGDRAWYSGAPEQDRFRSADYDSGNVLLVRVARRGETPHVEKLRTGQLSWHALPPRTLSGDDTLRELMDDVAALLTGVGRDVLQLELTGTLGLDAARRLDAWLEDLEAQVVDLKVERGVREAPTDEDFGRLATGGEPLVAAVARRLRDELDAGGAQAEIARRALRQLFHAHQHVADGGAR